MSVSYKTGDPDDEARSETLSLSLKKAPKIIDNNTQIRIVMGDSEEDSSESPIFSITRLKN